MQKLTIELLAQLLLQLLFCDFIFLKFCMVLADHALCNALAFVYFIPWVGIINVIEKPQGYLFNLANLWLLLEIDDLLLGALDLRWYGWCCCWHVPWRIGIGVPWRSCERISFF